MIPLEEMTDEQFEHHTLSLLQQQLGPYGMARFLRTYRSGPGDYSRDRHNWLDGLTVNDVLNDTKSRDPQHPAPPSRA